jgi:hypothetical protein
MHVFCNSVPDSKSAVIVLLFSLVSRTTALQNEESACNVTGRNENIRLNDNQPTNHAWGCNCGPCDAWHRHRIVIFKPFEGYCGVVNFRLTAVEWRRYKFEQVDVVELTGPSRHGVIFVRGWRLILSDQCVRYSIDTDIRAGRGIRSIGSAERIATDG